MTLTALVGTACSHYRSPLEQQRDVERELSPKPIDARVDTTRKNLGVLRIRVYVDDAFTSTARDSDERLREIVSDASGVLAAQLGVSLTLVGVERFTAGGNDLLTSLEALRKADPATDVDVVVGSSARHRSSPACSTSSATPRSSGRMP
ncbi:MAG TPA: hypothetical protein VGO62_17185 [Myxococcota bacterium]